MPPLGQLSGPPNMAFRRFEQSMRPKVKYVSSSVILPEVHPPDPLHAAGYLLDRRPFAVLRPVGGGRAGSAHDFLGRMEGRETALESDFRSAGDEGRRKLDMIPGPSMRPASIGSAQRRSLMSTPSFFRGVSEQTAMFNENREISRIHQHLHSIPSHTCICPFCR